MWRNRYKLQNGSLCCGYHKANQQWGWPFNHLLSLTRQPWLRQLVDKISMSLLRIVSSKWSFISVIWYLIAVWCFPLMLVEARLISGRRPSGDLGSSRVFGDRRDREGTQRFLEGQWASMPGNRPTVCPEELLNVRHRCVLCVFKICRVSINICPSYRGLWRWGLVPFLALVCS